MPGKTPLVKKLVIRPGNRVLVKNPPVGFVESLTPLPEGAEVAIAARGKFDHAVFFARNSTELRKTSAAAVRSLRPDGVLWICYPKLTSGVESDLSRDRFCDLVAEVGLRGVTQIAIDDVWSAVRLKPQND
ncbi:hypothetical protein Mal4_37370 [Maioricimonas rarisocia]|uniref:DUF3052 domain-containing protein n=1 Tax=Maioricimonas rarisocia TaxID=2528026 RepID=A0A517ZA86_9PLAN|nr:hypothetical protein [Maioricimonas rarisocia]QDU39393.1 hypothetical protein Mal4_37370 [Maioricimonas rarisocia]